MKINVSKCNKQMYWTKNIDVQSLKAYEEQGGLSYTTSRNINSCKVFGGQFGSFIISNVLALTKNYTLRNLPYRYTHTCTQAHIKFY